MPILQRTRCPDDPRLMLEQRMCVAPLSKNLEGLIEDPDFERRYCDEPQCASLTTAQRLHLKVTTSRQTDEPCDEDPVGLDGEIVVTDLVHVFDQHARRRGFHAGEFRWVAGRIIMVGKLSGITNAGTHRRPAADCQRCESPGSLQGRLCGSILRADDPAMRGTQLLANYLLQLNPEIPEEGFPAQDVRGTLEGVLVRGCGCCG